MMKTAHRFGLICILMLFCIPVLRAKGLAAYHVGDVAEQDIVTPVALDVIDPAATTVLTSAEAKRTPVIFRVCSDTTNTLAKEFLTEFAEARSNFVAAVQDTFHQTTIDEKTIGSPDFGYLITAFNIKNKNFPVGTDLAATWARGNPGLETQNRLLNLLLLTMQHPIRPDDLPENFVIGETARLVPVNDPNEKLTLADAETRGGLIAESNLIALSQLRIIFCREFSSEDEQPLAHALTVLLEPNCIPDADLTQLARDRAVSRAIVAEHYEAGQLLVRQGAVIDAKTKLVLDELNEKSPDSPGQQIATQDEALSQSQPMQSTPAVAMQNQTPQNTDQSVTMQNQTLKVFARNNWPIIALAISSILALFLLWRLILQRRNVSLLPARATNLPAQNVVVSQADLAPQLARVVREAVVQELAVQRRELLVMQRIAATEIVGLVRRLDELQMTMQERVQAYEMQIQKLEQELAMRTEENHELLKLKIEMTRQQLEEERTHNRMDFN
jgi:7TM-HD extracellular